MPPGLHTGAVPSLLERPLFRRGLIAVLLAAVVVLGVVIAKGSVTGLDRTSETLPSSVLRLVPDSGSHVLSQSTVGLQVAVGYDAELTVNGVTLAPREGVVVDGLSRTVTADGITVTFTPAPGRLVERLASGENTLIAMVWKQSEGRAQAQSVSWSIKAS
jgi:hypothetical protein